MAAQASQQFGDGILTALDQRDAATSPQGADRLGKHHRLDLGRRKDCDDGTPLGFGERGAQALRSSGFRKAVLHRPEALVALGRPGSGGGAGVRIIEAWR